MFCTQRTNTWLWRELITCVIHLIGINIVLDIIGVWSMVCDLWYDQGHKEHTNQES
jgi:hypothetical protein